MADVGGGTRSEGPGEKLGQAYWVGLPRQGLTRKRCGTKYVHHILLAGSDGKQGLVDVYAAAVFRCRQCVSHAVYCPA